MATSYVDKLLADNEKIILVTRQHWFVFFRSILFELVFAAVIVGVVTVVWRLALPNLPIWIGYLLLVIPLISLLQDYFTWLNREYIITNLRVMQAAGIFNKNVTDSSLDKVNDVKLSQSFLGRIFGFGDIEILTASELGVNLFKTIGDPIKFKTAMLNSKENLEHGSLPGGGAQENEETPENIPALIERLDQLRQKGAITEQEFEEKKADLLSKL
jgi:uncharacterized membrane protein YdbT with pleckstrin-like domain